MQYFSDSNSVPGETYYWLVDDNKGAKNVRRTLTSLFCELHVVTYVESIVVMSNSSLELHEFI